MHEMIPNHVRDIETLNRFKAYLTDHNDNCIRCFIIIFLNKYLLYDIYSVITFSTCNRTMILKIVICSKYKVIELFTRLI